MTLLKSGLKVCKHCKEEKPLSEFYTASNVNKTPQSRCKKCHVIKVGRNKNGNYFNVYERTNWIL